MDNSLITSAISYKHWKFTDRKEDSYTISDKTLKVDMQTGSKVMPQQWLTWTEILWHSKTWSCQITGWLCHAHSQHVSLNITN